MVRFNFIMFALCLSELDLLLPIQLGVKPFDILSQSHQYMCLVFKDYYLSVTYKRLVEGHVFRVNIEFLSPMIRIYAHCARNSFYK